MVAVRVAVELESDSEMGGPLTKTLSPDKIFPTSKLPCWQVMSADAISVWSAKCTKHMHRPFTPAGRI